MSEHQRGAWGTRDDPSAVAAAAASQVWWPTAADQQAHHQQLLTHHQQQQLAAAVQQHEAAVRSTAAAAAAQQLFSYKMANNNFQNQMITTNSAMQQNSSPNQTHQNTNTNQMRYGDYAAATGRPGDAALAANQAAAAAAAAQWWSYPTNAAVAAAGINNTNIQNHLNNANAVNTLLTNKGISKVMMNSKPRGRMTAYAFFVQTCREEHKKKHPDESVVFKEFSKKCAERWKTMSEKEKKRFHEMADKDKKRYEVEMQNYIPPKGEKVRGKKRKQIKDPNAPKRSLSAFFWFCNDERGQVKALNPDYGVGDIAKELGRKWADCEPHTKQKYEAMAEKDKARYEREMTEYKNKSKPGADLGQPMMMMMKQPESDGEQDDEEEDDDE